MIIGKSLYLYNIYGTKWRETGGHISYSVTQKEMAADKVR